MADPNESVQCVLDRLIDEGQEIGLQVSAYLGRELVIDASAGAVSDDGGADVASDTLFTAFSASKGVTATCVHMLADRGLVDYDAPIARYWPEFGAAGKAKATVRHALTHRVGIPQDPPGFDLRLAGRWDDVCRATAALEPLWEPGTQTGYHALTYGWMLGELVRRVDGRPIARFLEEEVCRPLRIDAMYFGIPPSADSRVAKLTTNPDLGPLDLPLNPSLSDPAGTFNLPEVRQAAIPGAGLIVNARSLARHYAMLANGGEIDGVRLLSREGVALAQTPELASGNDAVLASVTAWQSRWSLGYTLGGGPGPMSEHPNAFGYEGVGTIGFADPEQDYAFAFLKNFLDWSPNEMRSATLVAHTVAGALGLTLH